MVYPHTPPPHGGPPSFSPHGQRPPARKSNKVLWVVLSVVGVLLFCGGGFGLFAWKMLLSPNSGPRQIVKLAKAYKQAEDANNTGALTRLLCSADAASAEDIARGDAKVAPGDIDVRGTHTINSLGAVVFADSKGTQWTLYFRKEGGEWRVCPSARNEFKAADATAN